MPKKTAILAQCRLCLQTKNLQNSHIVSRFLWKRSGVTGAHRKFNVVSPTNPELNRFNQQDGFRENLLCRECEQKFSVFEDYFSRTIFAASSPVDMPNAGHCILGGLDYEKLKLFQMSLLWRMGVTSDPFYANVNLGKHAETLRQMLYQQDPGQPWQYGCIATQLKISGEIWRGAFSPPVKIRKFNHTCYGVVIAGMHWFMLVTSHTPPAKLTQLCLSKSGEWVLFQGHPLDFRHLGPQIDAAMLS